MEFTKIIDFKKLEVYEAGALLLTYLAYPEKAVRADEHANIHAALCNWALRLRCKDDVEWSQSPQLIKPCYAFFDEDEIAKILKSFARRLRDRAVAGKMALAFLKEAAANESIDLPKGIKHVSLNEMSVMVLPETGQSDPENIETRMWRPSLPVIHICAAVQLIMQMYTNAGTPVSDFTDILASRQLIEQIIATAQDFEPLLARTKLKIDPGALINFRLSN